MIQTDRKARWRTTFTSLGIRDFRNLWFGIVFMMGGMQMQSIARGYLVYDITSSALLLGLVSMGFAVPLLILSLFGGAAADRLNRKRLIQACQLLAAIASLAIALSISTKTVTWVHLFIASALHGVVFALMVPSRQALIPQLVSSELITNALALNAAAYSATTLLAPALAGNLYVLIGADGVYYVITAMEIAAVVFTGSIRHSGEGGRTQTANVLREIREGLGYVRRRPLVIVLIIIGLATALLAMPIRMLLPIFIVDVYHGGPKTLGLLVSFMGLGALAGSLVIAAMGRWRRGAMLLAGGIISGASLVSLAVFPLYLVAAIIMLILGIGDSIRRALNQTMILEVVDEEFRGRVVSLYTMNFGLAPLGIMPASLIAQYLGVRAASAVLGGVLLAIFTVLLLTQKKLRRLS
jgi:MFS family permease